MLGMEGRHTVFYDGVCGLCDRFTQLVLRADADDRFRFAALQGEHARRTLGERGIGEPTRLDTVYVLTADGQLLDRADAVLFVLARLPRYRRWAALLRAMTPEQFARGFIHPEHGRRQSLDQALQVYAWHGRHHTAHITSLRERRGW